MRFSTLSLLVTAASAAFSFAAPVDSSNGTGSAGAADGDLVAGGRTSGMLGGSDVGNDTAGELLGVGSGGSSVQASGPMICDLLSGLNGTLTSGLAGVSGNFDSALNLTLTLGAVFESIAAFTATLGAVLNIITDVTASAVAGLNSGISAVSGINPKLISDLSGALNSLSSSIANTDSAFAGLGGAVGGAVGAVGSAVGAVGGAVGGAVSGDIGAIGGGIVI